MRLSPRGVTSHHTLGRKRNPYTRKAFFELELDITTVGPGSLSPPVTMVTGDTFGDTPAMDALRRRFSTVGLSRCSRGLFCNQPPDGNLLCCGQPVEA